MRSQLLWCMLLFLVGGVISPARAAKNCTVSSSGVAFGNYDPTSITSVSTIGSVKLTCTYTGNGFTATLTLSTGSSGSFINRTLTFGAQSLTYNLYVNTNDTQVFGDGSGATYDYTLCYAGGSVHCTGGGNLSGTQYSEPIYGLLPAGQDVRAGTYTDTITATVTF